MNVTTTLCVNNNSCIEVDRTTSDIIDQNGCSYFGLDKLENAGNVNNSSISDGQVLAWNATNSCWEPADNSGGNGSSTLDHMCCINDVSLNNLQDGQVLVYCSTNDIWTNDTIAAFNSNGVTLDGNQKINWYHCCCNSGGNNTCVCEYCKSLCYTSDCETATYTYCNCCTITVKTCNCVDPAYYPAVSATYACTCYNVDCFSDICHKECISTTYISNCSVYRNKVCNCTCCTYCTQTMGIECFTKVYGTHYGRTQECTVIRENCVASCRVFYPTCYTCSSFAVKSCDFLYAGDSAQTRHYSSIDIQKNLIKSNCDCVSSVIYRDLLQYGSGALCAYEIKKGNCYTCLEACSIDVYTLFDALNDSNIRIVSCNSCCNRESALYLRTDTCNLESYTYATLRTNNAGVYFNAKCTCMWGNSCVTIRTANSCAFLTLCGNSSCASALCSEGDLSIRTTKRLFLSSASCDIQLIGCICYFNNLCAKGCINRSTTEGDILHYCYKTVTIGNRKNSSDCCYACVRFVDIPEFKGNGCTVTAANWFCLSKYGNLLLHRTNTNEIKCLNDLADGQPLVWNASKGSFEVKTPDQNQDNGTHDNVIMCCTDTGHTAIASVDTCTDSCSFAKVHSLACSYGCCDTDIALSCHVVCAYGCGNNCYTAGAKYCIESISRCNNHAGVKIRAHACCNSLNLSYIGLLASTGNKDTYTQYPYSCTYIAPQYISLFRCNPGFKITQQLCLYDYGAGITSCKESGARGFIEAIGCCSTSIQLYSCSCCGGLASTSIVTSGCTDACTKTSFYTTTYKCCACTELVTSNLMSYKAYTGIINCICNSDDVSQSMIKIANISCHDCERAAITIDGTNICLKAQNICLDGYNPPDVDVIVHCGHANCIDCTGLVCGDQCLLVSNVYCSKGNTSGYKYLDTLSACDSSNCNSVLVNNGIAADGGSNTYIYATATSMTCIYTNNAIKDLGLCHTCINRSPYTQCLLLRNEAKTCADNMCNDAYLEISQCAISPCVTQNNTPLMLIKNDGQISASPTMCIINTYSLKANDTPKDGHTNMYITNCSWAINRGTLKLCNWHCQCDVDHNYGEGYIEIGCRDITICTHQCVCTNCAVGKICLNAPEGIYLNSCTHAGTIEIQKAIINCITGSVHAAQNLIVCGTSLFPNDECNVLQYNSTSGVWEAVEPAKLTKETYCVINNDNNTNVVVDTNNVHYLVDTGDNPFTMCITLCITEHGQTFTVQDIRGKLCDNPVTLCVCTDDRIGFINSCHTEIQLDVSKKCYKFIAYKSQNSTNLWVYDV